MKEQIRTTPVNVMKEKKKKAKGNCSISVLSNMVTTGHMWPFEFVIKIKFKIQFLTCTGHISSAQ